MTGAADGGERTPEDRPSSWSGSARLYDAFAAEWDSCFEAANHRNAYDILAWEFLLPLLPPAPAEIVDVGCGTGRWAEKLLALGHRVIAIEQAPGMVAALRAKGLGPRLTVIAEDMERVEMPPGRADLVIAMGSVQYAREPARMIRRFGLWIRPGGRVFVCIDSLFAVVLELVSLGRTDEALHILDTGVGVFAHRGEIANLHIHDRRSLEASFADAGLVDTQCRGLLISMSALGREPCLRAIASDKAAFLDRERRLARFQAIADLGKHLVFWARRPVG